MDNNGYQMYNQQNMQYGGQSTYGQPGNQYMNQPAYGGAENQYMNQPAYGQVENQYINQPTQESPEMIYDTLTFKERILNFSAIMGLVSCILLTLGLLLPTIDFSHFHESVDFQYNFMKLCKNVRLASPIWTGLPWGIIIGIILMLVLSFNRIPQFKLIPCMLIIAMFVIMLVDMDNVIKWADDFLNSELVQNLVEYDFKVNRTEVFKSLRAGIYLMVAGTVTGIISCISKPITKK